MSSTRSKLPVGSAPWIITERRQVVDMIAHEAEDFSYDVIRDLEWLNAHMDEIFTKTRQLYVFCSLRGLPNRRVPPLTTPYHCTEMSMESSKHRAS
jgi:hypothetical protein